MGAVVMAAAMACCIMSAVQAQEKVGEKAPEDVMTAADFVSEHGHRSAHQLHRFKKKKKDSVCPVACEMIGKLSAMDGKDFKTDREGRIYTAKMVIALRKANKKMWKKDIRPLLEKKY